MVARREHDKILFLTVYIRTIPKLVARREHDKIIFLTVYIRTILKLVARREQHDVKDYILNSVYKNYP